ncbi:MAG: chemotaxis protein CheB [Thermoanaerobaculia bacterium]
MATGKHDIIVIGTSAGGGEALDALVEQLPHDLDASVIIVQHMAPENRGTALLKRLKRHEALPCTFAEDGETILRKHIYLGPSDSHLLVKARQLLVRKGARENRYRPGIDPLFRSAAASHGSRVIGVILTGMLDDGTAGMQAIKKCGGLTVVQDPKTAAYPDMPRSIVDNVEVDHCVQIGEMGALLERLVAQAPGKSLSVPDDVRIEATIAERVLSDVGQVNGLGHLVPYNCPNCGGVLWEMEKASPCRYRCHTGHSFTSSSLAVSQSERIEDTLWISLRMFEERKNLMNDMARRESRATSKKGYLERARETEVHIELIREMLLASVGK